MWCFTPIGLGVIPTHAPPFIMASNVQDHGATFSVLCVWVSMHCVYMFVPKNHFQGSVAAMSHSWYQFQGYSKFTTLTLLLGFCVCICPCWVCLCPWHCFQGYVSMFTYLSHGQSLMYIYVYLWGESPMRYFQSPPSSSMGFWRNGHIDECCTCIYLFWIVYLYAAPCTFK